MKGGWVLLATLALVAVSLPAAHGAVDVLIIVDMSPWLAPNSWNSLYNSISSFLTQGNLVQSYAFAASSFSDNFWYGFSFQSVSSVASDFAQFNQDVLRTPYDNTRAVPFTISSVRSQGNAFYSQNVVIFSDFQWQAGEYNSVGDQLRAYFQAAGFSSGRLLLVQLNGGSSIAAEGQQLASSNNGYASSYSTVEAYSAAAFQTDFRTLVGITGQATPPPDINSPDFENTGCIEFADVVFVVDSSNSIKVAAGGLDKYWVMQLQFVSKIIERTKVGPNNVRVGLLVFADTVRTEFRLSDTTDNKEALISMVKNINFLGGLTATSDAIRSAKDMFLSTPRAVPRIMILITDGVPNSAERTIAEARTAKLQHDIVIATVGVNLADEQQGQAVTARNTLVEVSSRQDLFLYIRNFDDILDNVALAYTNAFCRSTYCQILNNADILFIFPLDDGDVLQKAKDFAIDALNTMVLDDGSSATGTRIAIMTMGSSARVLATLDANLGSQAKQQLRTIISGIQPTFEQSNNIDAALNLAYSSVFVPNGDRSIARNLVILLAHLVSQQSPTAIANRLKEEKEATIFPIQVAINENPSLAQQLKEIDSEEPIDGGIVLYRYTNPNRLVTSTYRYMRAACSVIEWYCVEGGIGVPGPPGDTGNQGPRGDQGARGMIGDAGGQGQKGNQGTAGFQPGAGQKGDRGEPGPLGAKGNVGFPGGAGEKGNRGIQGPGGAPGTNGGPGFPGDAGAPGNPGLKGFRGQGVDGGPGQQGDKGNQGPPGFPGLAGQKGLSGNIGQKGNSGVAGPKGFRGSPGLNGSPGPSGIKGGRGTPGNPGVSIPGANGEKGNLGPSGNPGINGSPGNPGSKGMVGDNGLNGFPGSKGQKGLDGIDGTPGTNGNPGQKGNNGSPGFGLPGDNGEKGEVGMPGNNGIPGSPGRNGNPGSPGIEGELGRPGNQGSNGINGGPGFQGVKGMKGGSGNPGNPGVGIPGQQGLQGFSGNPGSPGGPGTPGSQGRPGFQGLKGSMGNRGIVGGVGLPGDAGNPGARGDQGDNGTPGQPGNGEDGDSGNRGNPGQNGLPGSNGRDGQPGGNGNKGLKGLVGDFGSPGNKGNAGNPGTPGTKGQSGLAGTKGNQGEDGVGPQGDAGNPGSPGNKGGIGLPGQNGAKGMRGDGGTNGQPGGPGPQGIKGELGPNGDRGSDGSPGPQGPDGPIGRKGDGGIGGRPGSNGVEGIDGRPGVGGRPGPLGPQGDVGFAVPGDPGSPGNPGPRGPTGPTGPAGSSVVDQCKIDNGGCQQLCVSLFFSHYCACHAGYTLQQTTQQGSSQQPSCADVARPGFNGAGVDIVVGGAGGNGGTVATFPTADVLFIVDDSMRDNFNLITNFISEIVGRLNVLEGTTRFAVVYYDTTASHYFTFRDYESLDELQNAIRQLQASGRTPPNIANGLTYARNFMLESTYGARDTNKLAVVFTLGNDQLRSTETSDAVAALRNSNIPLVAVAIGSVDINYLTNTLQTFVVPITDLNSLGTSYINVISTMRQALGMETDLVFPPTPPGDCANRLDIAFIVDASSSISQQNKNRNFGYIRHFLQNLVGNLGISYTGVRVSFIVFSNYASVRMTLDQTWDLAQVTQVIKQLPYIGGDTNIAYGLRAAREVVFTSGHGDRFDVSNLAVLITDGRDNVNENELAREAQLLKQTGADVICIGVTQDAYMAELQTIATRPTYAIQVDQYTALQAALSQIISLSCNTADSFPRADIAIVIDASDNVDTSLSSNLNIIQNLLNSFSFNGGSDVRIGIVAYGRTATIVQNLDSNIESVISRVRSGVTSIPGSEPNVEATVDLLTNEFFTEDNGDRLEAPNIALFFTSGGVTVSSFKASADKARTSGIAVLGLGVSFEANSQFLQGLAFRPELALEINSYNQVNQQSSVITRAARIAVGMVYVPHWRPYIPRNQICWDTCIHGVQCFCWDTKRSLNSTRCINIDECSRNNGGCSHDCVDTDGSFRCGCPEGMTLGIDKHTCQDVNECDASPCHGASQCLNTNGGYYCLEDGPIAAPQVMAGVTVAGSTNSLVGATLGTAVGTIILMLVVAVVVRTVRRRQQGSSSTSDGHDNAAFSGRTNATLKASTGAFDTISVGASTLSDVDSLASFSTRN